MDEDLLQRTITSNSEQTETVVSKQYEVPEVTSLFRVFRIALEISLFTGPWTGRDYYPMCCNRVKVIVPVSTHMTNPVERNVSSTHIKDEVSM